MCSRKLRLGKMPPEVLESIVFGRLGVIDPRVLVKPKIGEDAAIIDFGDRVLVLHSDPITGAIENIGWLAVNVSSNDVATRGARPRWLSVVILLPENSTSDLLDEITRQIDHAARELGMMVVCGHTEVTPSLNRPILICTAIGEASKDKYVTSSGAKVGDKIILTKGAAIEGTAIFAHEFEDYLKSKLPRWIVERAKDYVKLISVLREAMIAVDVGGVTAMHDPTEGGVLGGVQELARASNVGFILYEDEVIVNYETEVICKALNVDPLRTISSGSLLITVRPDMAEKLVEKLISYNIKASIIGEIVDVSEGEVLVKRDGMRLKLTGIIQDHLWLVLERKHEFKVV